MRFGHDLSFQVTVENMPEAEARKDLDTIWEPAGRWQEYIEGILSFE